MKKLRVAITFPSLPTDKGVALLSQNRQFQWSKSRTVVYPVIPASAATLLKENGNEVLWIDGIAEGWTYDKWLKELIRQKPDIILIESKTPVIKRHWQIIKDIKKKIPKSLVIMAGDHVTALPDESFKNTQVDYILSGGNFDVLLLQLVEKLAKKESVGDRIIKGDRFNLDKLPHIDRELTRWQLYAYQNGNYKYFPGTYIMAGRDCWWRRDGGCTFCSWTSIFPQFSFRSVENVLDEVGQLIDMGIKEIFDDTGTFLVGDWLRQFCLGMIDRGYHKKVVMGCNMRFGYLSLDDYTLMAKAGFRFILYGLESANQKTLDRLNKGTHLNKIEPELVNVNEANKKTGGHLEPHVTCMVGYPWESKIDAEKTVNFCKRLFNKGLISSLQATIIIPYPGTKLFKEAEEKGWLTSNDWDDFDMKRPVMKSEINDSEIGKITQQIYLSALNPAFIWKTLTSIKSLRDMRVLALNTYKYVARFIDFRPESN